MKKQIKFRGELLDYIPDFHGEPVLWITAPGQKAMENMEFCGGNSDKYCVKIKKLPWQKQNKIFKQVRNYSWYDITNKEIKPIGQRCQAGIGKGIVDDIVIHFAFHCNSTGDENFYTIVEISEKLYESIKKEYEEYIDSFSPAPEEIIEKFREKYIENSMKDVIMYGWDLVC